MDLVFLNNVGLNYNDGHKLQVEIPALIAARRCWCFYHQQLNCSIHLSTLSFNFSFHIR